MKPFLTLFAMTLLFFGNGANALAEVPDFDFSGQASPPNCSGSVVSFGQDESSKAILMTNGHCVGMLSQPTTATIIDRPYSVKVKLFKDQTHSINVRSKRILYGSISTYDIALVELDATYAELLRQGVRSRRIATTPSVVGDTVILPTGYFRQVTSCPILGIIPFIKEDIYQNINAYKYRDCQSRHGTSGSPLINPVSGEVVGMNYTGNDNGESCTYDNPCEVDHNGHITVDKGASYGDPVHQIMTCLDVKNELDLHQPGCGLPISLQTP